MLTWSGIYQKGFCRISGIVAFMRAAYKVFRQRNVKIKPQNSKHDAIRIWDSNDVNRL